ncbi:uncharacterized protein LOC134183632 [Corticium candelabrum]|uniref:uncharacterized protein LOC134183632 n=1 Tax=Corticium candelabrum TaxID=121492 RepID=UPI002E26A7FB|nr:uncharacterized protein LOC134183632 [Corticium candelabrum]
MSTTLAMYTHINYDNVYYIKQYDDKVDVNIPERSIKGKVDYRLYDVFHYSVSRNFLNSQLIAIVLYDIGIFELCKSCANDGGVIDNFRIEEHLPNDVPRVCFFLSKPSFGDEEDSVDFFSTFVASNSQTAQYVLVFQICVSHFYCVYDFYTIPASCSVDVDRVGVDELRLAYRLVALGKENARSKSVGTRRLSSTRSTNRHNCSLHQRPDYAMKKASGTLQQAAVKQHGQTKSPKKFALMCKDYIFIVITQACKRNSNAKYVKYFDCFVIGIALLQLVVTTVATQSVDLPVQQESRDIKTIKKRNVPLTPNARCSSLLSRPRYVRADDATCCVPSNDAHTVSHHLNDLTL